MCIYIYIYICMYVSIYLPVYLSMYVCMHACMHVCMCLCVWVWGQPLFPRDLRIVQFFSFKAGGASSPSSLAPTKTLDECWWYLTWSVRRTCHVTISISEFCDSLTAATVLSLSLFKTCLGPTAFSRAKKYKSIWASWTDILSYKCMYVCMYTYFQLLPYTFHKSLIAIHGLIQLSSAPRFLGTQVPRRHDAVVAVAMHQS